MERRIPIADHIMIQLYNCSPDKLNDEKYLKKLMIDVVKEGNGVPIQTVLHKFDPYGISIVTMLEESHVSIHTYPEFEMAFADIFVCGTEATPYNALQRLISGLSPRYTQINTIKRE